MTNIPSLQLNKPNTSTNYDRIYENLASRANQVKPNESKAKLVQQDPIEASISAVVDTFQDAKNVIIATKTGKMNDNSLGRINDLGLKAGALLIATFLASHAKTKTDAIMQFIGGGSFLASMSLWPKIFINLPARIIHGFPVDRKYISAQGDKKDFGLDNQFLVWDCIPDEVLRKDAKNAGIDFDSANGKEKIQRKEQKVMLQTRALNLATVGFGAPLMTSLFGNFVEPKVRRGVINHGFKKTQNTVAQGIGNYLDGVNVKTNSKNEAEIRNLFKDYTNRSYDDEFFAQLANKLNLVDSDFISNFKDSDDLKPLEKFSPQRVAEELKNLWKKKESIDIESLKEYLKDYPFEALDDLFSDISDIDIKNNEQKIGEIIKSIGDNYTVANVKKALKENGLYDKQIDEIINGIKIDTKPFEQAVIDFEKNILSQTKARLKAYLDLSNPIVGSKSESVFTQEIEDTLNKMFKNLGLTRYLKGLKENNPDFAQQTLENIFIERFKGIRYGTFEYTQAIREMACQPLNEEVDKIIERLIEENNINRIHVYSPEGSELKDLEKAVYGQIEAGKGTSKSGIINLIQEFIKNKITDLESIKSKAVICANFEARVNAGEFNDLTKEQLEIARKFIYNGSAAVRYNNGFVKNTKISENIIERIFNKEAFSEEANIIPNIKDIVQNLKDMVVILESDPSFEKGTLSQKYAIANSYSELVKTYATKLQNNKNWLKTFGSMAIILVGVTLLIQPFFGNIKKEFQKEGERKGV